MSELKAFLADGQVIRVKAVTEIEYVPRPAFRYVPAWLTRLIARAGVRTHNAVRRQVARLEDHIPPAGSSIMILVEYGDMPVKGIVLHNADEEREP
jgi:hypothetical protein